ncbi:MAG: AAA family ATPase [Patescibacteria group bacterium]
MDIQDKGGPINSRPKRDEYYLSIAKEVSARSTCYRANIGAIIVRDDQIIATGYVGAPRGTKDCLSHGFCLRDKLGIPSGQRYETCRSVHAEQNAIINAARAGVSLFGGDMYIWGKKMPSGLLIDAFPCFICKKMILNAGIRRVIVMTKEGKPKTFHIEDWTNDWQNKDILEDENQYGVGFKMSAEPKAVEEKNQPEIKPEPVAKPTIIQTEIKTEIAEEIKMPEIAVEVELTNQNITQNNMDKKIIAVVGLPGAGKSVTVKKLEESNFKKIYFGEVTFDEIQKRGLELNNQNEKMIREDLRKKYGMAAFAILNIEKIRQAYSQGDVVIESMYSWQEYLKLKDEFGDNFYVLAVQAGPKMRHERLVNREEYHNGMKRTFTMEEAKERDRSQIENLAIAGPIAIADYTIVNDGSLDELYKKIEQVISKINF